jgi:hypothetical protein
LEARSIAEFGFEISDFGFFTSIRNRQVVVIVHVGYVQKSVSFSFLNIPLALLTNTLYQPSEISSGGFSLYDAKQSDSRHYLCLSGIHVLPKNKRHLLSGIKIGLVNYLCYRSIWRKCRRIKFRKSHFHMQIKLTLALTECNFT